MKLAIVLFASLVLAGAAHAANRAQISTAQFAQALRNADPASLVGVDKSRLSPTDLRVVRCIGPDEEPTEFQCVWLQRTGRGWKSHKDWLALDGGGWHLID